MTENDDLQELRERALASETDANQLFEIAAQHPEVFAEVAANSNAYPDLLDWLENVGDDRVKAVVAARRGGLIGQAALAQAASGSAEPNGSGDFSAPQMPQLASESQEEPEEAAPETESSSSHSPFAPKDEEDLPLPAEDAGQEKPESLAEDIPVTEEISSEAEVSAEGAENGTEPKDAEVEKLAETSVESQDRSEVQEVPDGQGGEVAGDEDATRLGSIPVEDLQAAIPSLDEGATHLAETVSLPTQPEAPTYPMPQQQPVIPPPANYPAYSPYPVYYANPAAVSVPQRQKPKRNWGIIILTVLLVIALISFTVVVTWIVSSRGGKAGASGSDTSTNVATTAQSTTTATETAVETGKPIPADAIYEDHGFYTPSKNIGCLMHGDSVYCQIGQRQWEQGCDDIWAIELTDSGVNQHCDPGNGTDPQTPASYGSVYYNGDYACGVEQYTGVDCWNSKTGHGFTMRKAERTTY